MLAMSNELTPEFFLRCQPPTPDARWVIGYSGGLDSTVLLHLCARYRDLYQPRLRLVALHVNHGLADEAAQWQQQCEAVCAQLDVDFVSECISVCNQGRQSIEQVARRRRYQVYRRHCESNDLLLLAHHENDQVETLLYRLTRGSGTLGLRGMDLFSQQRGLNIWRPLLSRTRDDLHRYGQQHRLQWCDDPSNADDRFDRNFIRNRVLPLLASRWPHVQHTLARSARHAADSARLLAELAEDDLSGIQQGNRLMMAGLQQLSQRRLYNCLRFWIRQQGALPPSEKVMQQIHQIIAGYHGEQNAIVSWADGGDGHWELRSYQGQLWLLAAQTDPVADWHGVLVQGAELLLPSNLGCLHLELVDPADVGTLPRQVLAVLDPQAVPDNLSVAFRQGGEQFRPQGRPRKLLKKWLQEWQVPPWERARIPLLYGADDLIAVLGYGVAAGYEPQAGQPVLCVTKE